MVLFVCGSFEKYFVGPGIGGVHFKQFFLKSKMHDCRQFYGSELPRGVKEPLLHHHCLYKISLGLHILFQIHVYHTDVVMQVCIFSILVVVLLTKMKSLLQ